MSDIRRCWKRISTGLIAGVAIGMAAPAAALVTTGDAVTCTIIGSDNILCSQPTAIVGTGPDFGAVTKGSPLLDVNFDAKGLTIRALAPGILDDVSINIGDTTSAFTGFVLIARNGFSGYDAGATALSSAGLSISLTGTSFATGDTLRFSVDTAASAVPEAATWTMMLIGFGAVGFALRTAKRRSDARFEARIQRITAGLPA